MLQKEHGREWDKRKCAPLIERKLRTAGIKVFGLKEAKGPVGLLTVEVSVLSSDTMPMLVYVSDCGLRRFVAVNPYAKDHIDFAWAVVWKARARYGYAGRQVFEKQMRQVLEQVLDEFIDAFLAVNDK